MSIVCKLYSRCFPTRQVVIGFNCELFLQKKGLQFVTVSVLLNLQECLCIWYIWSDHRRVSLFHLLIYTTGNLYRCFGLYIPSLSAIPLQKCCVTNKTNSCHLSKHSAVSRIAIAQMVCLLETLPDTSWHEIQMKSNCYLYPGDLPELKLEIPAESCGLSPCCTLWSRRAAVTHLNGWVWSQAQNTIQTCCFISLSLVLLIESVRYGGNYACEW